MILTLSLLLDCLWHHMLLIKGSDKGNDFESKMLGHLLDTEKCTNKKFVVLVHCL